VGLLTAVAYSSRPSAPSGARASGLSPVRGRGLLVVLDPRPERPRLAAGRGRTPTAEKRGSGVTVRDIRHFDYRPRPTSRALGDPDLRPRPPGRARPLVSYWGPTLYAHTILSWQFEDAPPLAVSIETGRRRASRTRRCAASSGSSSSSTSWRREGRGALRTSFRGEQVFLYRLATSREAARALLEQYLEEANVLARQPPGTTVHRELHDGDLEERPCPRPGEPFDWRLLANGYVDRML